jgi:hypothetical protein
VTAGRHLSAIFVSTPRRTALFVAKTKTAAEGDATLDGGADEAGQDGRSLTGRR